MTCYWVITVPSFYYNLAISAQQRSKGGLEAAYISTQLLNIQHAQTSDLEIKTIKKRKKECKKIQAEPNSHIFSGSKDNSVRSEPIRMKRCLLSPLVTHWRKFHSVNMDDYERWGFFFSPLFPRRLVLVQRKRRWLKWKPSTVWPLCQAGRNRVSVLCQQRGNRGEEQLLGRVRDSVRSALSWQV